MCYEQEYSDRIVKIAFDRTGKKGPYGKSEDDLPVYVDEYWNINVELDDVWFCKLVYKSNGLNEWYFALPVEKVETDTVAVDQGIATGEEKKNIVAVGEDTLYSKILRPGKYDVYRSFDGRYLELIPSDDGDIFCTDNTIGIDDLDRFVGTTPRVLEYTCRNDRFLIKLEE